MRNTLLLATLAVVPLSSACGTYVALGESLLPYQGRPWQRTAEAHLGYTRAQSPNWSAAVAVTSTKQADSAVFFVPTCDARTIEEKQARKAPGCHPIISQNSSAFEVQYRWHRTQSVRPVASVALGWLRTGYTYISLVPVRGADSTRASPFMTLRGGAEYSLAPWVHVAVLAGYRESFRNTSLNTTSSNSGFTIGTLFMVGRRYRDP